MTQSSHNKYAKSPKGKISRARSQKKYDEGNQEKRLEQKRDYMRRKRSENPNYCKWK